MSRKIFLIACEASGDLHGAHLVEELRKVEPDLEFSGLGGPRMAAAGVRLLQDMTRISALGFGDVIRQYFTYRVIFYRALAEISRVKPDALILIDSPAFNLRFAKKIRSSRLSFPVFYYISPQIWAWGARRIHTIKKTIDRMLVILPFEVPIYEKAGVPCEFVGHPLLDHVEATLTRGELQKRYEIAANERPVGLFSGSRVSEVRRILPVMLESAVRLRHLLPQTIFFLSRSPNVPNPVYDNILKSYPEVGIRSFEDRFYDLAAAMDFALVASGTATLETALLGTPFFLLYKASWSTYVLGKWLIQVPYLGLVNLLAGKKVVPEFIQGDARPETIAHEAKTLLENRELYEQMKEEFLKVRGQLGERGASARAAAAVINRLNHGKQKTVSRNF